MEFLADHPVLAVLFVFFARVTDVAIGTLRTIFVFRGFRVRSALLGFVESLTWVLAASLVLGNLTAWYVFAAYAGGYATGNYVGIWLEAKLAMGLELVRIISADPAITLARRLRADGFSVVELDGHNDDGRPVEVLFAVVERRLLPRLLGLIAATDPSAIYTISDVKLHRASSAATMHTRKLFGLGK
jgi:uncharacterized protein YebE (UPF0316 family)